MSETVRVNADGINTTDVTVSWRRSAKQFVGNISIALSETVLER